MALIASVGERKISAAIPELVSLLEQNEFAGAAATALGSIGGAEAEQALAKAYPTAKGNHRPVVAAAILKCAEKFRVNKLCQLLQSINQPGARAVNYVGINLVYSACYYRLGHT